MIMNYTNIDNYLYIGYQLVLDKKSLYRNYNIKYLELYVKGV